MQKNKIQQNELDTCERRILISIFGKQEIPELTATGLKLLQINPNDIIRKFENLIFPLMTVDGKIDCKVCKKLLRCSRYGEILEYLTLPDNDFYLSDVIVQILGSFLPGINA